jgi:hypothetical protein
MIHLPHGETNITLACQNKCVSCNHFIPLQAPWFADPAVIERDLNTAAKVMHFGVYNTVGGEPTLHPRLVEILSIIRQSGIANRIEITTNGQNSDRWSDEIFRSIDSMIVTPYKLTDAERAHIIDQCETYGVSLQFHPVIFTQAAYKWKHPKDIAAQLYRHCWYAANRNVIDEGYFYRCCIGRFIPEVLLKQDRHVSGLALDCISEDTLRAYMTQSETPIECTVCASNCGERILWREQPDREAWLEESLG